MSKNLFLIIIFFFTVSLFSQPVIHRPPYSEDISRARTHLREAPQGNEIINPAEFGRTDGVFMAWAGWATDLIADIARPVSQDYTVFMCVCDDSAQTQAYSFLESNNVNMDNVVFIHDANISNTSMWIRDYAPFFIKEDGSQAIDDFFYGTYGAEDLISYTIADTFDLPLYDSSLMHHGGNHISDGNGMGFFSTNIYNHNPAYSHEEIDTEFKNFFGFDSLYVIQPMQGDGTGHIDMFCKLLSDTLFIVGEYDLQTQCYPGDRDLLNDIADHLEIVTNLDGRPFRVERIPMGPFTYGGVAGTINYTYTNSLIVNDLVLVPVYGFDLDDEALQVYQDLMPDHTIIPIDSEFIIQYWGAVHCVTNEYFSENPLIILHEAITEVNQGIAPIIKFRLNPKFSESYASVFYKLSSSNDFIEVTATLESGIWSAQLPVITENFEYYISGSANSGNFYFETYLPENQPYNTFYVECIPTGLSEIPEKLITDLKNYPNPFNPSTEIRFNISDFGQIENAEISIYNLKGQKVKSFDCHPELVEGYGTSHSYSVVWNGDDDFSNPVSSGIYFYKLNVNGKTKATNKCLLLK